jgi:hypothetical protein
MERLGWKPVLFIGLCLVLFTLAGCKSLQPAIKRVTTTTTDTVLVTETRRDTTLITEPDSAWVRAWFECDSLNQVVMTELQQLPGQKTRTVVKWKDNTIEVAALVDSQAVYFSYKEKHTRESSINTTVIEKVKEPPWWKKLGLNIRTWITICIVLGLYTIFKNKLFKKK